MSLKHNPIYQTLTGQILRILLAAIAFVGQNTNPSRQLGLLDQLR